MKNYQPMLFEGCIQQRNVLRKGSNLNQGYIGVITVWGRSISNQFLLRDGYVL